MASNRIIYQNWIADLGRDPDEFRQKAAESAEEPSPAAEARRAEIREAVTRALGRLSENERELIERYYFMGQSYREIAEKSGRAMHRLEALHQRAVRKLRRSLAPLVSEVYGWKDETERPCRICRSPNRAAIDRLIAERDPTETWRPLMKRLRDEFGLDVRSPQSLIGHQKYH